MRGLMNSWAPISGLDCPSAASRAICSSCAVRSVDRADVALADVLPGGGQLAVRAPGEAAGAHRGEHLARGPQFGPRVAAALLAAEPLPVQQAGPGELGHDARPAEPGDGLLVELLGLFPAEGERPAPGQHPERPFGPAGQRRPLQQAYRARREGEVAAARGALRKLGQRPQRVPELVDAPGDRIGGVHRLLVASEPVAEQGGCVGGDAKARPPGRHRLCPRCRCRGRRRRRAAPVAPESACPRQAASASRPCGAAIDLVMARTLSSCST